MALSIGLLGDAQREGKGLNEAAVQSNFTTGLGYKGCYEYAFWDERNDFGACATCSSAATFA